MNMIAKPFWTCRRGSWPEREFAPAAPNRGSVCNAPYRARASITHNGIAMRTIKCTTVAALAALAAASTASAQTPTQPGDGSLVFNPDMRQWAFRAAGVPWFCMADGRCVQIRFDGVAPGQLATAEITALGFAGGTYYVA